MALKWKMQPWFEASRGEYYLKLGERIDFGKPLQFSGGIASVVRGGVTRQNKIELVPYADTTGVEPCPGISIETIEAETSSGVATGAEVGASGIAREIALLRLGYVPMVYAAGTTEPYNGMLVAPHPSGCQEWQPGMAILGKFQTEVGTAINFTDIGTNPERYVYRIKIDVEDSQFGPEAGALDGLTDVVLTGTPDANQVIAHNGTNWVNMDVVNENVTQTADVGTLSKEPFKVDMIFGLTAGGAEVIPLVEGDPSTNQGEYSITGTPATTLTTNNTDAITTVIIQYRTEDLT